MVEDKVCCSEAEMYIAPLCTFRSSYLMSGASCLKVKNLKMAAAKYSTKLNLRTF